MDNTFVKQLNCMSGARQSRRLSPLLTSDYIPVDERALPELIQVLAKYAENIHFYGADNRRSGTWSALFKNSEILTLALALNYRANEYKDIYLNKRRGGIRTDLGMSLDALRWIDNWLAAGQHFKHYESRKLVFDAKKLLREKLADELRELLALARQYKLKGLPSTWYLSPLLDSDASPELTEAPQSYPTRVALEKRLRQIFEALTRLRLFISTESAKVFDELIRRPAHDPAVSMMLAFLRTYQYSQQPVNEFPAKLLNFYYGKIHGNTPEQGKKESLYLQCLKTADEKPVLIKKGTRFNAGKSPDLRDILYQASDNSIINGATLNGLYTVFLQRNNKISPANSTNAVTRIKDHDLFSAIAEQTSETPYSLFGYDGSVKHSARGQNANMGLCISARVLALKEGKRKITLSIEVSDRVEEAFYSLRDKQENAEQVQTCDSSCPRNCSKTSGIHRLNDIEGLQGRLARCLYKSLSEKLNRYHDLVTHLLRFCRSVDDTKIKVWLAGDKRVALRFIKDLFLFLYCQVEDVEVLGRIHRELLVRRIFDDSYLSSSEIQQLKSRVTALSEENGAAELFKKDLNKDLSRSTKSLLIYYFAEAFQFKLSTDEGWLSFSRYQLHRLPNKRGFSVTLELGESAPAITDVDEKVHGKVLRSGAPVLSILLNPMSRVYAYSYLRSVLMLALNIRVDVEGCRDLCLFSEYGKVDKSNAFLPFSALPNSHSTLYIGGYEYARKTLSRLKLNIRWQGLPVNYGGFTEYYRGYGPGMSNEEFMATVAVVANGNLVPCLPKSKKNPLLFDFSANTGILNEHSSIDIPIIKSMPRLEHKVTRAEYENLDKINHAYLCLGLKTSEKVFGHKVYPRLTSEVLVHNNRHRKQQVLPQAPYTPEINRITVDYSAHEDVSLASEYSSSGAENTKGKAKQVTEKNALAAGKALAYYLVPMGFELTHKKTDLPGVSLFPTWRHDGNLYIGFQTLITNRSLSLYFRLREDASHSGAELTKKLLWRYYSRSGWKSLRPEQILSDSTNELRCSGIINIELPPDRVPHSGLLSARQYWLSVSSSNPLEDYASLQNLHFDAIRLESLDNRNKLCSYGAGLSDKWQSIDAIPGIQSFKQYQASTSHAPEENSHEAMVRLFERLRHKNRAITPWDYERLVLERFPQVDMVKCLPSCRMGVATPSPGNILLIVTPKLLDEKNIHAQGHNHSSVLLNEISEELKYITPNKLRLEVANARYEIVQVRCSVQFNDALISGELIKQLKTDISYYLSPWSGVGIRHTLGWRIRTADVESFIQRLNYVNRVTKVSLVKVFESRNGSQSFRLQDTAAVNRQRAYEQKTYTDREYLTAQYPWTLPLPARNHEVNLIDDYERDTLAEPVGVKSLEIGNTFIIQGGEHRA